MKTEQIRCILCNKHLDLLMKDGKELFLCSECQAYFCPSCLNAVKNYQSCPAARLLGVKDHAPKFLKILPPKPVDNKEASSTENSPKVKILPRKKVKILKNDNSTKKKE